MGVSRQLASFVAATIYRPSDAIAEEYHKWYYGTLVWNNTTWMGIPCQKSVSDMWNYQEILWTLRPSLVVEFGTFRGGSALFFAHILRQTGGRFTVLSVDIEQKNLHPDVAADPDVVLVESSSAAPRV